MADQMFGKKIKKENPYVIKGYHFWAKPVVRLMQKSKIITKIVSKIAIPWANEMAYQIGVKEKGSVIGKIFMTTGVIMCTGIGFIILNNLHYPLMHILIALLLFILLGFPKRKKLYCQNIIEYEF